MKDKKIDFLVLIALTAISVPYAILTRDYFIGKPLVIFFIFFVPQILYLAKREKKPWKKIFLSTFTFGLLFGFFFEFIQEFNRAYSVVSSVFPFKLLGIVPPDNVIGHMIMTFSIMVFYEHFILTKKTKHISPLFFFITLGAIVVNISLIIIFLVQPARLKLNYSYAFLGTAAIIPVLLLGVLKTERVKEIISVMPYFFFLFLLMELLAVGLNWWVYPGNTYIGWVEVFSLRFPFEELFFWMIFYAPALISYRELFLEKD
ncbi:hypothetical protein HY612_01740 [Candidatus Roizmanbacteria bacterium]|nr:hypothetical protein [Candidatus Roizmanbacteria bacterium]